MGKSGETFPRQLMSIDEIPDWQRENEYLLSGYRPVSGSFRESFNSVIHWHNETISIQTHLVGAALFAYLPWHFYQTYYRLTLQKSPVDLVLFCCYTFGVAICFLLSSGCHILWNHSPYWASIGNRLDYLGIILLMWTASLPSIYYGFYCNPTWQLVHWILTSILAISCCIITMNPSFSSPRYRGYRATLYAGLGFAALAFILHGLYLQGFARQRQSMSLDWMALMAALNVAGAAIYAFRVPERFYPYRFDFIGASHQIFHVAVVLAGLTHHQGLARAFHMVKGREGWCVA